ncbi:MAG: long-chain fatty acid--CoA ligase [Xenococcus sp. (in: cyanobacteria)]
MFYFNKIKRSFSQENLPILGRSIPSLLDEACDRFPNSHALNQWHKNGYDSQSNREFQRAAEELALGLQTTNIAKGERVALLMHSGVNFLLADLGSLLAGTVNVPIDLTQTLDNIAFILSHSEAKVLILSNLDLLAQIIPYLGDHPHLQTVIVVDVPDNWQQKKHELLTCEEVSTESGSKIVCQANITENITEARGEEPTEPTTVAHPACLSIPMLLCQARRDLACPHIPQCIQLFSLEEIQTEGKKFWSLAKTEQLRSAIDAQDLATIIYIAGETGQPKGVMLSHENITADILTTFKTFKHLKTGAKETVLSFLPLNHIFARALIYGHLNYGHSLHFTTPQRAIQHFPLVKPTIVATVPRLLEKVYHKICDRGSKLRGVKKIVFNWALRLAQDYELGTELSLLYALQLKLADILVYAQWRSPFGGKLQYFISGGAALKAEIANVLSAAGITILQGYGLTETSSVICCNREKFNRAGTVGMPIPGTEIKIARDGEILIKAPYLMQGYYKNPEATRAVLDESGWLHTGDLGEFTDEGFLTITGQKKDLFKLSIGKYVMPLPLEEHLRQSDLVKQAVVVGTDKKFCGLLIFPDLSSLCKDASAFDCSLPIEDFLQQPAVNDLYQTLVNQANQDLPSWSKVKRFQLVNGHFTVANGLLDADLRVRRAKVNQVFANAINTMYPEEKPVTTLSLETKSRKSFRTLIRLVKRKLATQKTWLWLSSRRDPLCEALKTHFTLSSISWRWKFQKTVDSEELD